MGGRYAVSTRVHIIQLYNSICYDKLTSLLWAVDVQTVSLWNTFYVLEYTSRVRMAAVFKPGDMADLLAGKHVVFLGHSVTRAIYKVPPSLLPS